MPTHSAGALGGLECSQEERRRLALKSLDWSCPHCGIAMRDALPPMGGDSGEGAVRLMAEAKNAVAPSPAVAAAVKKQPSVEETAADNQPKRINAEEVEAGTGTSLAMAEDEDDEIHHMAQPSSPASLIRIGTTTRAASRGRVALWENPILWMLILSGLFIALLLRRLLLNLHPTTNTPPADQFRPI